MSKDPHMVEMELREIQIFSVDQPWQRVLLEERRGEREFPIYIGESEALFLEMAVKKAAIARPLTHDLVQNILQGLGARLVRVEVVDLRDETFFGKLILRNEDGLETEIDSRPSDALILAVKHGVPIYVADRVLDAVTERGHGTGESNDRPDEDDDEPEEDH